MKNERLLAALTALNEGDLSVRLSGEDVDQETVAVFNAFVTRMDKLLNEVNRVMLEIGDQGRLGGQADIDDVSGKWAELRDNVNQLSYAMTINLRGINEIVDGLLDDGINIAKCPQNEVQRLRFDVDRLRRQISLQVKS